MGNLPPKEREELSFWTNGFHTNGTDGFRNGRRGTYQRTIRFLPELANEQGYGLDMGCGLISMFEETPLNIAAVDPLLEEYRAVYDPGDSNVEYVSGYVDGGMLCFDDATFDFAACVNVIDHTYYHKAVIQEILRVLKPGGTLYFMVNFDPELCLPHHVKLWNWSIVMEELPIFMQSGLVRWEPMYDKYQFWGVFTHAERVSADVMVNAGGLW